MRLINSRSNKVWIIVSIFLLHCTNVVLWSGFDNKQLPEKTIAREPVATEGVLLAKIKHPNKNKRQVDTVLKANGAQRERSYKSVPGLTLLRMAEKGNAQSQAARMQGLQKKIDALMATGHFEYVEPDWQVQILQTPTDTAFVDGDLWGLKNTGQDGGLAGIDINVEPAWSITTGSPEVVVGVIDTGIRYSHQDISGNMWTNPGEIPDNGIDDDGNGWIDDVHGLNAVYSNGDPMDDENHGTHVAGTIAATAFDSGSHVGVAYNVKLMALKALNWTGSGSISDILTCIEYAIDMGVDVLNNSWGGTGFSQALLDAIDATNSAGILFIAAAGNSASNNDVTPYYPACYDIPNVISVAAIDRSGDLATFSNYGHTTVDLAAPGVSIYSTTAQSDSSYALFNGTSMATPHVAGVAALVISAHPAEGLVERRGRLLQSTTPLSSLVGKTITTGMVNAEAAILLSDDGELEIQVNTISGEVIANEWNPVYVQVTDLSPVTNATVSIAIGDEDSIPCLDNGSDPDIQVGDAIYTGEIYIPEGSSTVGIQVVVTAPDKTPFNQTYTFQVLHPPPNDNFANRIILSNSETVTTGTSSDATLELNEPINPFYAGKHTVWWEWTPTVTDTLVVSTMDTMWDTTLAIYQGTDISNLTLIGSDDDGAGLQSVVHFPAIADQTYYIQVNGYANASGPITLHYGDLDIGIPNDHFRNRILLEPGTIQITGSNQNGSIEAFEPFPTGIINGTSSIWYEWVAPSDDPATITTIGSQIDTVLGIWQGTELSNLVEIASNDDGPGIWPHSTITFEPVAGESYIIQIYGWWPITDEGKIVLNYPDPVPPSVPNDHFSQRILLSQGTTQTIGTNVGATIQNLEPINPATAGNASVWWEWIAPATEDVTIHTTGSAFNTTIALYTGIQLNELVLIASNDDSGGSLSSVTFPAIQGESYMIQVNGSGDEQGEIQLNYPAPSIPPPANDDFENRIILETGTTETIGTNLGATLETDEPLNPTGSGTTSVWWEWYALSTNEVTITTSGSDFDTTIAVYTGRNFSELVLVAENNDSSGQQSSVSFPAEQGRGYIIRICGFGDETGNIVLTYPEPDIPRPENDNFINRILLEPGTTQTVGYNEFATQELHEPPSGAGGATIWWEWIPAKTETVTIDTFGSTIDTTLAIYTGDDLETLHLIGFNDDAIGYASAVTFDAIAGTSYMIQLDSWPSAEGLVYLNYPMPFPITVTPSRLRLSGSIGQTVFEDLIIFNGDSMDVDFTVDSNSGLIQGDPATGIIPSGTSTLIRVQVGPLPDLSTAVSDIVEIDLIHPTLSQIELPVEVIDQSTVVDIPDPYLRSVIESNLGRLPGEPISQIEMGILTSLDATNRGIKDLTGLEYAVNLFYLHLDNNQISDITTLGTIEYLVILGLSNNNIFDISPLLSNRILLDLDIRWNYLDINPGSDDLANIELLQGDLDNILYDPQKDSMISYSTWTTQIGLIGDDALPDATNGPLQIENLLAYGMGLNPLALSPADMPTVVHDPISDTYRFSYFRNLNAEGVTLNTICSYDLQTWEYATPVRINILWDDEAGHQLVEAVFEKDSSKLFFSLDVSAY